MKDPFDVDKYNQVAPQYRVTGALFWMFCMDPTLFPILRAGDF